MNHFHKILRRVNLQPVDSVLPCLCVDLIALWCWCSVGYSQEGLLFSATGVD